MKKSFILGLLVLVGFSNAVIAAPSSLTISGDWDTVTGDLGSSFGATWTYNTDLSTVPQLGSTFTLPSGGTVATFQFEEPSYTLTGTNDLSGFAGFSWAANIFDNTIASIDGADPGVINAMLSHGLDTTVAGDVLFMSNRLELHISTDPVEIFDFLTVIIFDEGTLSSSLLTLPPAETLLEHTLLSYVSLSHGFDDGSGFQETGFASYAQAPSAVPIPAAAFMFAPALLGFLGLRRKAKLAHV